LIAMRPDTDTPGADENAAIAGALSDYADLLEAAGEDGFRILAFRRASDTVRALPGPLRDVFAAGGLDGLTALPAIGRGIGSALVEMLTTGRWTQLERLKGESAPEELFRTLPGVGPVLARRLSEDHDLESLEDLESALHRGAPAIEGIGPRRRKALEAVLSERLGRRLRRTGGDPAAQAPGVGMLLDVDRIYRERAKAGSLRMIAPRRFNPEGRAWLPILHARHGDWHFTALFSNTARAHDLGKTGDWVVIYAHIADGPEERWTVVTETRGPMAGERVVRGRERECEELVRSGAQVDATEDAPAR
jgi:hypothetical protein